MARNRYLKKLGLNADTKYVIIHADDMGLCHSQNIASIHALAEGSVNSGSIMATCPGFSEIAKNVGNNKNMDLGIHLTLTSEWDNYKWGPLLPVSDVPSLVDNHGFFSCEDFFDKYDIQEVELELCEQINTVIKSGIKPTHLDCHRFCLYRRPDFMALYLKLSRQYKIPPLLNKNYLKYFNLDLSDYDTRSIVFTDRIYIATPDEIAKGLKEYYTNVLNTIEPGLNVILIHPAYDDVELKRITGGLNDWGAAWRQTDFDFFTSNWCKETLHKNNIIPITWKEIVQLINDQQ